MKILSVELENLNSLVGRTKIDFTEPIFAANGIFAIVGPTGAGKSTILDAICLALYGRTPRLDNLSKAENEIMSRHTGKCFAEIVFETNRNGIFRCTWSQRRARERASGALQAYEHQIADADSGEILKVKNSEVPKVVAEKTGMDYERFTRAMLLAQGGFAKFLQSGDDERGEVLEQLTGTEIYGKISIGVQKRHSVEEQKLKLLDEQLKGGIPLDAEALAALREELDGLAKRETVVETDLKKVDDVVRHYETVERLTETKKNLDERRTRLEQSEIAFRPETERLDRAQRAATLEPVFKELDVHRKALVQVLADIEKTDVEIPRIESNVAEGIKLEGIASAALQAIQDEKEARSPILQRVRELNTEIKGFDNQLKDLGKKFADAESLRTKQQRAVTALEKNSSSRLAAFPGSFEQRLQTAEETQRSLNVEVSALLQQRQLSQIHDERSVLEKQRNCWEELDRLQQSIIEFLREEAELDRRFVDLRKEAQAASVEWESLQNLEEEQDREIERLDEKRQLLERIRSLEDERNRLIDGKPCPLCGATEHPYAEGNVPSPDETEKILAETKKQRKKTEKSLGDLEIKGAKLEKDAERLEEKKNAKHADVEKSKQQLAAVLRQLDLEVLPEDEDRQKEIDVLQARITGLTQTISDVEVLQVRIKELDKELLDARKLQGEINNERVLLQSRNEQFDNAKSEHETVLRSRDEKIGTRREIYGNENPDEEERRRAEAERNALQQLKETRESRQNAEQRRTALRSGRETLNLAADRRREEIETASRDFAAARTGRFADEEEFLAAKLPLAEREELETKKKTLELKRAELETLAKENAAALEKEFAARPSDGDLSKKSAVEKKNELGSDLKSIRENIGRLGERLRSDEALHQKRKDLSEQRERQAKEFLRWKLLYDLIGSSDGKKFRIFAQGLTFKMMIEHANRHLARMNRRYLLVQDDAMNRPLGLAVVDADQANVVRSTKNLSGGESFIVSLALALGLSAMASRNVRVDSLFLDEGFGTLDDQVQDQAISVLESLRQDGKLIGIISHIAAIKERIVAQIRVNPIREGRSVVDIRVDN